MFDWFPILKGRYMTAEQYLLFMELAILFILLVILKCCKKSITIPINGIFIAFIQFGYLHTIPLIIVYNNRHIYRLIIVLIFCIFSYDVCFAMHNIEQGFIIQDLFCAQFSTHFSRMFTTINQEHIYVTLTEQQNFIYLNIQSQNSKIDINLNGINQTYKSKWIRNRWLHQSLLNIQHNNTIYIYNDNQIQGPYYYYDFFNDSINLVSGGDLGNTKLSRKIWKQITRLKNIDVINIGGDIVYDNGMVSCYLCWDVFFNQYSQLCDEQKKLIPLILAIGNHDIGRVQNANLFYDNQKDDRLPYYFQYFPQHTTQQLTYFKHQLGNIQFITLDSSYVATIDEQVKFLEQSVSSIQQLYISYHVPVIPLIKENDEFVLKLGKYLNQCTLVFEHHKHNRKRSKALSFVIDNNEISYKLGNTIYLGNGAMGVVSNKKVNHHSIEIMNNDCHFYFVSKYMVQAISCDGRIVDQFKITPVL